MVNAYFVVALFFVFYYIRSQEESTDIGKNMYANWNIIMPQKNTLVCAYWSICGKYGGYGISKNSHFDFDLSPREQKLEFD